MSPVVGDAAYQAVPKPTYRVVRPLGGHGPATLQLLLMEHLGFGDLCVQKTILAVGMPPDVAFREPRILDRFRDDELFVGVREAQWDVLPNAVTWVMPYYPEGSVHDTLVSGYRFPLSAAVAIACDMMSAVSTLHVQEGYVHGDLKPGQLLLRNGRTRAALADLGSAVKLDVPGTGPMLLPTLLYTAPEAWRAKRVSLISDIYAAATAAFEIFSGPLDYVRFTPIFTQPRLDRGERAIPESSFRWQPHVPTRARLIVNRAMSLRPGSRPSDPLEIRDALRRSLVIDWQRQDPNLGPVGSWTGTWPIRKSAPQRVSYRVESTPSRPRGLRIVVSQRVRPAGPWRRIPGVPDVVAPTATGSELRGVFVKLEQRARHAMAARR